MKIIFALALLSVLALSQARAQMIPDDGVIQGPVEAETEVDPLVIARPDSIQPLDDGIAAAEEVRTTPPLWVPEATTTFPHQPFGQEGE